MKTVKQFFSSIVLFVTFIAAMSFGFVQGVPFALAAPREQKVYYFLHDHLGGISAVTDEEGNVVERRDYLPYGADRLLDETDVTDYGFTGKEKDPESELYYYGARYYDPVIGRFISQDPWEGDLTNPQTLNKYNYGLNNPLLYIDFWGLFNIKTDTVEKGDTLSGITPQLNEKYDTSYTIKDYAKLNRIADPNKIYPGQRITTGTIDSEGNVWQPPQDPKTITQVVWNSLKELQQKLLHYYRNNYQADLPQNIKSMNPKEWGKPKETPTHNIGTSGNLDYRGKGERQGQQAIYNKVTGELVDTPENMGSFDFSDSISEPFSHYKMDVEPWETWGNSPADTTTPEQRQKAYNGSWNPFNY